jgi:hypothetical protein
MTACARCIEVTPLQLELRVTVVETWCTSPRRLIVTRVTVPGRELISMRRDSKVTCSALRTEPQVRLAEALMCRLELADCHVRYVVGFVATPAFDRAMALDEIVTGKRMIEIPCVEAHNVKGGTEVLLVAFRTVPFGHPGVEAPAITNPGCQRGVTRETCGSRRPLLTQLVARSAVGETFETTMHLRQFSRRDDLGVRRERRGYQSNANEAEQNSEMSEVRHSARSSR